MSDEVKSDMSFLSVLLLYSDGNKTLESSIPLAATIRELLRLKVFPSSSTAIALNLRFLFRSQLSHREPALTCTCKGIKNRKKNGLHISVLYILIFCTVFKFLPNYSRQGMKPFSLDDTLKQLSITQQPCLAMWSHVLLQLCVSVTVLLHIRLLVNFLTLLQTAVLLLLLTKIT